MEIITHTADKGHNAFYHHFGQQKDIPLMDLMELHQELCRDHNVSLKFLNTYGDRWVSMKMLQSLRGTSITNRDEMLLRHVPLDKLIKVSSRDEIISQIMRGNIANAHRIIRESFEGKTAGELKEYIKTLTDSKFLWRFRNNVGFIQSLLKTYVFRRTGDIAKMRQLGIKSAF